MDLLLDTHAALWWWGDSDRLGSAARAAMSDPEVRVFFSAVSAYEIHQKARLGRLIVPDVLLHSLAHTVQEEGWHPLDLTLPAAARAAALDHAHRDPFDRMLAAQAQLGGLHFATGDAIFAEFDLTILW